MKIQITNKNVNADVLILPVFQGEEVKNLKPVLAKHDLINLISQDFKNSVGAIKVVYTPDLPTKRLVLLGMGTKKNLGTDSVRKAVQAAMQMLNRQQWESVSFDARNIDIKYLEALAFAIQFGSYVFNQYQQSTQKQVEKTFHLVIKTLNNKTRGMIESGDNIAIAANEARSLANHPGNVATPSHLAKHAQALAKKNGIKCTVLGLPEIHKLGLGLLEGVSKGSDEPPRFIILEYLPKNKIKTQPIVLIGKGLTFDSGGISIKPADRMEEMKYDMAGGATVLGIMEAASKLKLPHHIVGIIPSSENLISGKAVKPGDILKSYDGKTVEVINTDAEGRLILADAIAYANKHFTPRLMIDYATLTGSVVVALGNEYTGVMSNTNKYDNALRSAAFSSGEKFWKLPLADEYKDEIKSQVADIKNVGEKSHAGAINGGLFLESFVGKTEWMHMDIAGTAWTVRSRPHMPVGATAWGVYLTVNFLRQLK